MSSQAQTLELEEVQEQEFDVADFSDLKSW
jgi:hypothetical protein